VSALASLLLPLSLTLAQAEPAPPEAPPRPAPTGAQLPPLAAPSVLPNSVAFAARAAYRAGSAGTALGPRVGFSLGIRYERLYAELGAGFELGLLADLFHDRFSMGVKGSAMVAPGVEQPFDGLRVISQTSFAAAQTVAWRRGALRAWAGAGGGFTVGYFSSDELELRPGEERAVQPMLRGGGGLAVTIARATEVVAHGDYSWMLTHPRFSPRGGATISILGDLVDAGLALAYGF